MELQTLRSLIGKTASVDSGGPEKFEGRIKNVGQDFLLLEHQGKAVWIPSKHVKKVLEPILQHAPMFEDFDEKEEEEPETFQEHLERLKRTLIRVNHDGKPGILFEVSDEMITLVHDLKEFTHYPIFHIKSVRVEEEEQQENKKQNENNKNENENKKQSENNRDNKQENNKSQRNKKSRQRSQQSRNYTITTFNQGSRSNRRSSNKR